MKKSKKRYAMGGGAMDLLKQAPGLLDGIMSLLEGQKDYSSQPIVNAQTIKTMATPYSNNFAFGGEGDEPTTKTRRKVKRGMQDGVLNNYSRWNGITTKLGTPTEEEAMLNNLLFLQNNTPESNVYTPEQTHQLVPDNILKTINPKPSLDTTNTIPVAAFGGTIDDLDDDELSQLQEMADGQGITIEEALEQVNSQQENDNVDEQDLQSNDESTLADNFSEDDTEQDSGGQTFATGGRVPIEVEGGEIVQSPDGTAQKMSGPSHEEGGIDMNVPKGTKIYSDRLAIDGKTMQQRKASRMRRMKSIQTSLDINPLDPLAKNSLERTNETAGMEEQQDMALQQMANKIYTAPRKKAMGGRVKEKKYPFGGEPGDDEWINDLMGLPKTMGSSIQTPVAIGSEASTIPTSATRSTNGMQIRSGSPLSFTPSQTASALSEQEKESNAFSIGDYVGLAGNAFNAVAPLINTRNAARATKPNRNKYQGFGQAALQTNDYAMSSVGQQENSDLTDLETNTNTSAARNRNSASSVNTVRALDAVTNMGRNKAKANISASASNRKIQLLSQRAQLQNIKDATVARGQTASDLQDKADIDNYYSNMAANLTNLGTNVQGIGKNLNTSQRNQDDLDLMAAMTKNNIRFKRKNGRLVLANNT